MHSKDIGPNPNRLIDEKSPYLLQHAYNPVDWHPWGNQAFAKAKELNKPIFLSIGYSTCHWCHVMEHESFESPEVAKVLNEHFISIKVDREVRPDVDQVYMTFVQATTGSGGWPMSVWLTPDLKPFFGGTYFPPDDRYGRPGFKSLLLKIHDLWQQDQNKILAQSEQIIQRLTESADLLEQGKLNSEIFNQAFKTYASSFDAEEGGFGHAPKFPRPSSLSFLMRFAYFKGFEDKQGKEALQISLKTLDKMADGGMYDHIGGGFHRYSVDQFWHVPHYEKMLYDQAQLVLAYLEAYQITQERKYVEVVQNILKYVTRDMTHESGGFYSAEDADSLPNHDADYKTEGAFYVWEQSELEQLLHPQATKLFFEHFGIARNGNSPSGSDPHGELVGKNTLIRKTKLKDSKEIRQINKAIEILFNHRESRPHPHLDDKIITAWNGLMISAYAQASQILKNINYLEVAKNAAQFIKSNLYDNESHNLFRSYRQGPSKAMGFTADYAFLIQGLLDLYSASTDESYLKWAITLQETQDTLFWDSKDLGYFSCSDRDNSILIRMKDDYDGAEPSPSSVSVSNLMRLYEITGDLNFQTKAEQTAQTFIPAIQQAPTGAPQMLASIYRLLEPTTQVFLSRGADQGHATQLQQTIFNSYSPNLTLLHSTTDKHTIAKSYQALMTSCSTEEPKAYVCRNFTCNLPTSDASTLKSYLQKNTK